MHYLEDVWNRPNPAIPASFWDLPTETLKSYLMPVLMQKKEINTFIVVLNKMSLRTFHGLNRGDQGRGNFQDHFLGQGMVMIYTLCSPSIWFNLLWVTADFITTCLCEMPQISSFWSTYTNVSPT